MALDLPYNKKKMKKKKKKKTKQKNKNKCKLMYREHNNRTPFTLSVHLRTVYLAKIENFLLKVL